MCLVPVAQMRQRRKLRQRAYSIFKVLKQLSVLILLTIFSLQLTGNSYGASTCPKGNRFADGCTGAPIGGNFQRSNFFTSYALQSGQTYSTRPPWNVAGVDYPVGIPAAKVATLKDPAGGGLPTGCAYSNSNVKCASVAGVNFDNWDFSLHNGTTIEITSSVTGTVTIQNSKFVNGSHSDVNIEWLLFDSGGSANLVLNNNYIDGNAQNGFNKLVNTIRMFGSGTLTATYNVYLNIPQHGTLYGTGAYSEQFSYWEGNNYESGAHGEIIIMNNGGVTSPSLTWSYNTWLGPSSFGSGMTAPLYLSSGSAGSTITNISVNHSTFVSNLYAFTGSISGSVLTVTQSNTVAFGFGGPPFSSYRIAGPGVTAGTSIISAGTGAGGVGTYNLNQSMTVGSQILYGVVIAHAAVNIAAMDSSSIAYTSNYVDPSGTFDCFGDDGVGSRPAIVYTGNINLRDGSAIIDGTGANCHGHQ